LHERIKALLRFSPLALLAIAGLTAFLGWRAAHVELDFSIERLFESHDAEMDRYVKFKETFGGDDGALFVGYRAPDVLAPATLAEVDRICGRLEKVPHVRAVFGLREAIAFLKPFKIPDGALRGELTTNPLFEGTIVSRDAKTGCFWVLLDAIARRERERAKVIDAIRAILAEEERATGMALHLAGIPAIEREYTRLAVRDLLTFTPISVATFLLLLFFYFRNALGTILPLATVCIAVAWTLGLMQLFGATIGILTTIVPNLILIIGIADCIHVLSRYQEDLRAEPTKRDALAMTLRVMFFACFLTAFTTSIGFIALVTTRIHIVREFGVVCAAGFMVMWVAIIALMPPVLDVVPRMRARALDEFSARWGDRALRGLAEFNRKRWPWIWAFWAVVCVVSVVFMLKIDRGSSWLQDIRAENPVHKAHDFFEEHLSPVFTIDLEIDGGAPGAMKDPARLARIDDFQRDLRAWGASHALSFADLARELHRGRAIFGRAALGVPIERLLADPSLRALPRTEKEIEGALAFARPLEQRFDMLGRAASADFSKTRISVRVPRLSSGDLQRFLVDVVKIHRDRYAGDFAMVPTGKSVLARRAVEDVVDNMVGSLWLAALLIFACMWALFRSLKVGLLSMIPNFVPMFATAGLMGALGLQLNFSTATIFSISLGIAVDSTIHYLSRLRVELTQDADPAEAMRRAIVGAGRPMIFGTLLLVLGFSSILTSNFRFTFNFGLLGGFTMIVALLCDLTMTPTLMYVARPKVRPWKGLRLGGIMKCLAERAEETRIEAPETRR